MPVRKMRVIRVAVITVALLAIPAIAMLITDQVNWGVEDFAAAAALLATTGMAYEYATRQPRRPRQRLYAGAVCLVVLGTVWALLAVGIF